MYKKGVYLIKKIALILPIFLVLSCTIGLKGNSSSKNLWGYDFNESKSEMSTIFLDYNKNGEKIELVIMKNIEERFAKEIIDNKILLFKTAFQSERPSYLGKFVWHVKCPEELLPKYSEFEFEEGHLKSFFSFADKNYVAGTCSEEKTKYNSIYGFLYCSKKESMVEIHYFSELAMKEETNNFLGEINCEIY
jgi:hypothetical protein